MENVNCSFVHTPAKANKPKPAEVDCGFKVGAVVPPVVAAGPQALEDADGPEADQEESLPAPTPFKKRKR